MRRPGWVWGWGGACCATNFFLCTKNRRALCVSMRAVSREPSLWTSLPPRTAYWPIKCSLKTPKKSKREPEREREKKNSLESRFVCDRPTQLTLGFKHKTQYHVCFFAILRFVGLEFQFVALYFTRWISQHHLQTKTSRLFSPKTTQESFSGDSLG